MQRAARGRHGRQVLAVALWLAAALDGAANAADAAPQDTEALAATQVQLGNALRELDRDAEAAAAFRQALAAAPDDFAAHFGLGSVLAEEQGTLEEALAHLARAVELRPDDAGAVYGQAEVLRRLGRWEEALDLFRRATTLAAALDVTDENSRLGEAEALFALGRFAEARTRLEEGRERFPESRGFEFGLTWLLAACPDSELRDGERALELAEELYAERRSIGAAELVAAANGELGRCEEAAGVQRFVVEQATAYARPPEVMARLERAVAWYEAAPCGVPAGRPADERPEWPRRKADR